MARSTGAGVERDRLIAAPAGIDEDALSADLDEKGERIAEHPVVDFARRQVFGRTFERRDAKDTVMRGREHADDGAFHRIVEPARHGAFASQGAGGFGQLHARGRRQSTSRRSARAIGGTSIKMIDMAMRHEHGVDLRMLACHWAMRFVSRTGSSFKAIRNKFCREK